MMNGSHWRALLIYHPVVLLPSIKDKTHRMHVGFLLDVLSEIEWIAYGLPSFQKLHGLRLRLHVLCFQLACWWDGLYSKEITTGGLLYVHTVISHYSPWFEICDFRNASTERGEQFLAVAKRIFTRFTNRTAHNALLELFIRLHYEQKFKLDNHFDQQIEDKKVASLLSPFLDIDKHRSLLIF